MTRTPFATFGRIFLEPTKETNLVEIFGTTILGQLGGSQGRGKWKCKQMPRCTHDSKIKHDPVLFCNATFGIILFSNVVFSYRLRKACFSCICLACVSWWTRSTIPLHNGLFSSSGRRGLRRAQAHHGDLDQQPRLGDGLVKDYYLQYHNPGDFVRD